jgi:hypothetical protein
MLFLQDYFEVFAMLAGVLILAAVWRLVIGRRG